MGALPAHSVPERAADPFVDTNAMRRQNEMNKKMVQPVKKAMIKAILHKNIKELSCTRSSAIRAVASPRCPAAFGGTGGAGVLRLHVFPFQGNFDASSQRMGVLAKVLHRFRLLPSVFSLLFASRRTRDLGLMEDVWRFFCRARWGTAANLRAYRNPKDLYRDRNGWYPRQLGQRRTCTPQFEVKSLTLHDSPCLTMDLRITEEEIIAVSEAPRERGHRHGRRQASVSIIDPGTRELRGRFEVSDATINCCDVGPGLICLGSDDSKVRLYRRSDLTGCSN
ncbi:unnamed protein product, partial [Polarella glacialis]